VGTIEIIDAALTARIGQLDTRAAEAVEEEATAAFVHGLGQSAALDLARGLHWIAQGYPVLCSSEQIIDVLDIAPSPEERQHLADLLDIAYTLGYERQSAHVPITSSQPLYWLNTAMLGWHISLAFELANYNRLKVSDP
jgi:hypothetical protein